MNQPLSTRSEFPSVGLIGVPGPGETLGVLSVPTLTVVTLTDDPNADPALNVPNAWDPGSIILDRLKGRPYVQIGTAAIPRWGSFVIEADNVFSYRYAPGSTSTSPGVYASWADLYATYTASRTAFPSAQHRIEIDDRLAPAVLPAISGVAVQQFTSGTTFAGAYSPAYQRPSYSWAYQAQLTVAPLAVLEILADGPGGTARLQMTELRWTVAPGRAEPAVKFPAGATVTALLQRCQVENLDLVQAMISLSDNDLGLEAVDTLLGSDPAAPASAPVIKWDNVAAKDFFVDGKGRTLLQSNVLLSDIVMNLIESRMGESTGIGEQPGFQFPVGGILRAPAGNANQEVVTSFGTLASAAQLSVEGTDTVILQALGYSLVGGNATDGDTLNITDGTNLVSLTFRAAPALPTDVQIGGTIGATLDDLATVINGAGSPWLATVESSPQSGRQAVVIYRAIQGGIERYTDRIFGISQTLVARQIGFTVDGRVPQHYSSETVATLATTDPGISVAGFGTPTSVRPGQPGYVYGGNSAGLYVAEPAIGAGTPRWLYLCAPLGFDSVSGAGVTLLTRETRSLEVSVGSGATRVVVPSDYVQEGDDIHIARTDNNDTGNVLLSAPSPGTTIDGVAAIRLYPESGVQVMKDAAGNYWTTGEKRTYSSLLVNGAGATALRGNQTAVEVILAGGITSTLTLSQDLPVGVPLMIRRQDADGTSTLNLDPGANAINGAGGVYPVPVTTTVLLMRLRVGDWILL